ncbi:NAD(P)H-hydrate dehydratase [Qipengyuania sp. MTN3-11]|uniref:NAD(P)H-hydrate dehydratase n=1 Tax=Qipengyuania sp. MTN3-11 TaxID=3056557 RepID=UPI0036F3E148
MTAAVLSVEAMRDAERAAMDAGASEWELMQRAGRGAAGWVWRIAAARAVTVLCGPGNNGGDGYVIAEWLRVRGTEVLVVAPLPPRTDTAARAKEAFRGDITTQLPGSAHGLLVDCLFGHGLSRAIESPFAELLEVSHASHSFCIAIDLPSGMDSNTGKWLGNSRSYDMTLALGAWKQAHFLMPGRADMGTVRLVPIGLDLESLSNRASTRPQLCPPAADSHKYRRGLVAVVAGEMPGAPLLSALAAMRAGAGYVKLFSEHSHPDAPAELVIEGARLEDALRDERIGAVLVGPGLGRGEDSRHRLRAAVAAEAPLVLDADALHLLDPVLIDGADPSGMVATPHEGELARLCETFDVTAQSKFDRVEALRETTGMTILAKGPDTVLAPARGGLRFFPRGSSWLSAAGTGDALAGIIASRLAVGGDPAIAAEEAVWLHQEAARRAGPGFTAGGLAEVVQPALASFL